jgi:hypothetical protein
MYFLLRGYLMKLLEEAHTLARSKDRSSLLTQNKLRQNIDKENKVFLITTFHPTDNSLRKIVFKNWDLLGKSPTTSFLHDRKLMVGYRRPKNLRDILVRANVPFKQGDETAVPNSLKPLPQIEEETTVATPAINQEGSIQRSITDFFLPVLQRVALPNVDTPQASTSLSKVAQPTKKGGTPNCKRGFNFCNTKNCRYCPNLNKTGEITSSVTGKNYRSMHNVSCRSSNLIYCITCKRCKKQYVGQTLLRLKSRFVHHYYTVDKKDQTKPVGKHFSLMNHRGTDDMEIHVLEFIKKPPSSDVALEIRNRVEKRWIHLLRSPAPLGLNIED